jgi:cytochrome c oxidase cbb3-type subunit 3
VNAGNEPKLLDHEYDGIREYDNPLPGWWVNLFWLTIVFCVPYTIYYHGVEGRTVHDELDRAVAERAKLLIATYGELEPDAATLTRYSSDAVAMTGMRSVFQGKCAQCHAADGGGGVGPNLTDDHYINVKSIEDLPRVIESGVPLKGMPAWGGQLSRTEIVLIASYVAQLRGRPVAGRAAQGVEIPAWPSAPMVER